MKNIFILSYHLKKKPKKKNFLNIPKSFLLPQTPQLRLHLTTVDLVLTQLFLCQRNLLASGGKWVEFLQEYRVCPWHINLKYSPQIWFWLIKHKAWFWIWKVMCQTWYPARFLDLLKLPLLASDLRASNCHWIHNKWTCARYS